MIKKIIILGLLFIMIFSLSSCSQDPSRFSEGEHLERIAKRVEKRFMNGEPPYFIKEGDDITGFEVYPLYGENDELVFFLVEFEPYGFLYVKMSKHTRGLSWLGVVNSMYTYASIHIPWKSYVKDETQSQPSPDEDICQEVDEIGEYIHYYGSPYRIAEIKYEKRYLLPTTHSNSYYIPAVKVDGKENHYLNLVSMEEIVYTNELVLHEYGMTFIYFLSKPTFEL